MYTLSSSLKRFCIVLVSSISLFIIGSSYVYAASCRLSFNLQPATSFVSTGDTVTYTSSIKNIGTSICHNVSLSLFYADNEKFVSSSVTPRAGNYYWYIGNLGINKTSSMTVSTQSVGDGAAILSEGCASAKNGEDSCDSSSVIVASSIQVSTVSTSTKPTTPPESTTSVSADASKKERGMWIWDFPRQMNIATGDAHMKTIASYGFNAVYITIDDYLDIAALPEGKEKQAQKDVYFSQLATFVTKANALGITVDAEGGANNWSTVENRWKGFALIDAMKEYNSLYPKAKVRAFQYDVEPHTLSDYEENKAVRLLEYVQFVDQSVARTAGSDLHLSIVTPHFLDSAQKWTPEITYKGVTASTFTHLLSVMDAKPGNTILLMSYRNIFDGENGTKEISQVEIQEASQNHVTKVLVGQETGNVQPALITFYGSTKAKLFDALIMSDAAFGPYKGYGGTATHYIDSFLDLR